MNKYAPNMPRLTEEESATGVVKVIKAATFEQTNSFLDYSGQTLPW